MVPRNSTTDHNPHLPISKASERSIETETREKLCVSLAISIREIANVSTWKLLELMRKQKAKAIELSYHYHNNSTAVHFAKIIYPVMRNLCRKLPILSTFNNSDRGIVRLDSYFCFSL